MEDRKVFLETYQIPMMQIWDKVFKNGLSKTCGTQPLKKFEEIWSA